MAPSATRPPAQEQRTIISDLLQRHGTMAVGDTWYVISYKWYRLWKEYVGLDTVKEGSAPNGTTGGTEPDSIENNDIVSPLPGTSPADVRLRNNLQEDYDYAIVPDAVWMQLVLWYGGGPAISRKVIQEGRKGRATNRLEVYPLRLKAINTKKDGSFNPGSEIEICVSRKATLGGLKSMCLAAMEVENQAARLWNSYGGIAGGKNGWGKEIKDMDKTVEESALVDGQRVIVEIQLDDGTWPHQIQTKTGWGKKLFGWMSSSTPKETYHSSSGGAPGSPSQHGSSSSSASGGGAGPSGYYANEDFAGEPGTGIRGVCGLYNLGNTCFMNSALQCLSNTHPLTEYFLAGRFKGELNRTNPLGMKGQIAEQYGKLVRELWNGHAGAVAPKNFKWTLGKYAPQFSGYQQHDSQELLSFLLDGLHEDLNRVQKKPYVEDKDAGEEVRPDQDVAREMWERHLLRNKSVIVDLFQGQLKSTLVCPTCNKVSVTFDPFMYLSLPLPIPNHRFIDVVLVRYGGGVGATEPVPPPMRYNLQVPKKGYIEDIKTGLTKIAGVDHGRTVLADVHANRIYSFLTDARAVSGIREKDLTVAYELPANIPDDATRLHLVFRREGEDSTYPSGAPRYGEPYTLFGMPYILIVQVKTMTQRQLYEAVWARVARLLKSGWDAKRKTKGHKKSSSRSRDKDKDKDKGKSAEGAEEPDIQTQSPETDPSTPSQPSPSPSSSSSAPSTPSTQSPKLSAESSYPFTLRITGPHGRGCGRCTQGLSNCQGCLIEANEVLLGNSVLGEVRGVQGRDSKDWRELSVTIALDWEPHIIENYLLEDTATNHESVVEHQAETRKDSLTLYDCVQTFLTNERLGPDDPWYCPRCKEHRQAWKKFDLWSLPRILVVHLKRFQYDRYSRDKINIPIAFPVADLDLSKYVLDPTHVPGNYELFAISNHHGGLGGGHYTAFGKNPETGRWYLFNDSSTKEATEKDLNQSAAYMLFYQLKR
eukprot:TRINITY_DN3249_c1_g1_i3.p1 TRINITY_DN3249_c1_g1~~TRINITY_DN3249_c1_g1_i3.p1  ORF type:complete len:987 (+),score=255.30 TRINITY_DN3249_c1_g1_i3:114-3074(+)